MIEVSWSEAIRRKYPEPVVLVVSCDSEGKPDVMPAGWSMVTSGIPPMIAVSIGHPRYTHKLIEETGEFVLVFACMHAFMPSYYAFARQLHLRFVRIIFYIIFLVLISHFVKCGE